MCWTPSQFFLKPKHLPSIDSRIITKGDERSSCISAFTAYYFFLLFLSPRQQRNLRRLLDKFRQISCLAHRPCHRHLTVTAQK